MLPPSSWCVLRGCSCPSLHKSSPMCPHEPEVRGHGFQRGPGPTASCWRARRSLSTRSSALSGRNSSPHKPLSLPQTETSQGYVRFHSLRPSMPCHSSQWRHYHWTQQRGRRFRNWGPSSKLEQSSCTNTAWWESKSNRNHWQPSVPAAAKKQ